MARRKDGETKDISNKVMEERSEREGKDLGKRMRHKRGENTKIK